jgi:type I restriction enzyme S subunit
MSPELLLKHFDQISDTPDAVPRLRRFILDLAVRGKLVEQNSEDEPIAELLKRITGDTKFSQIETEELPFQIPSTWLSVKAGDLINMQYGKSLVAKDRKDKGVVSVYGSNGIVGYCDTALTEEPAIIIGRKGSAGALNLCNGPSWTTDVAYYLIPPFFFHIRFLLIVLQTLDLGSIAKGVKPGLNRTEAYQLPIVLPPLAEQHRIVAKVDELMALCDELEAAQIKRERRRNRLVAATLHGLNNGETNSEASERFPFEESARFYFNHLPRLTTRPEHIQQLRQTILRLGVSGKLHGINDTELRVFSVGDLCQTIDGDRGSNYPKKHDYRSEGYCLFLSTKNVRPDGFDFTECVFIDKEKHEQLRSGTLERGDVIVTTRGTIGNVAVYDNSVRFTVVRINSGMLILRPDKSVIYKEFLSFFIRSPLFTEQTASLRTGTAQPQLPAKTLRMFTVIVPSLEDQYRIVAKVSNLIALCDELEDRITTISTTRFQLLEATIHEALNGSVQLHANVS